MPALLRRAARLCAVSLAKQTQPFGTNGVDGELMGQRAVVRDIRKVYALPSDAFAAFTNKKAAGGFWKALQEHDIAKATAILHRHCPQFRNLEIRPFDGGAAHVRSRVRGRVKKGQGYVYIVSYAADLKSYINVEMKFVGYAKSGWAGCARALGGTSGLPGWITRHKGPARVEQRYDHGAGRAEIILVNLVSYASEVLSESQKRVAIGIAGERLFKALVIEERKAARATGF